MQNRAARSGPSAAVRILPGAFFLTYFLATVLLFFFGPWVYPIEQPRALVLFLAAAHVAFAVGYLAAVRPRSAPPGVPHVDVARLALVCVLCELVLLPPTSFYNTGSWIPNPVYAATELGEAYTRSLELRSRGVPWVNYLRIALAPLLALTLPLCLFYWARLRRLTKTLFVSATVGTLALSAAMGINAGAAHFLMLFPWFIVAAHFSGERRMSVRKWVWSIGVTAAAALVFFALFAATINARIGSFAVLGHLPGIGARLAGHPAPDPAGTPTPPATPVRSELRVAFDGLAGYFSHGYYAVYLSLREPFVPMYGIGHSVFLQRQAARLLDDDSILERPYPARIEAHGWNAYGYWATIYPWIASDVGFPGAVVVMLAIGALFGAVWTDVVQARSPWAVVFFGQLLMLLYYVPAHNKTMHTGEGVVAFLALLAGWAVSRRRPIGHGSDERA